MHRAVQHPLHPRAAPAVPDSWPCSAVPHRVLHLARYADIIIPWQRGTTWWPLTSSRQHITPKLRCHDLIRIYPNLELLPSNFQVRKRHISAV